MEVVHSVVENYDYVVANYADTRTDSFYFILSPLQLTVVLGLYYYFIRYFGPAFMKNRPAYNLDRLIQIYNLAQVFACGLLFCMSIKTFYFSGYLGFYRCLTVDNSSSDLSRILIEWGYYYYLLKIIDLADTMFFVFRKKFNQITFLHVYHHVTMVVCTRAIMKYYPGGQLCFIPVANSFVHTVMYLYYFITNYNPEYRKNIWWKKHITQLQILQFVLIFIHISFVFVIPGCQFPKPLAVFALIENFIMIYLFSQFYYRAYLKPKTKSK